MSNLWQSSSCVAKLLIDVCRSKVRSSSVTIVRFGIQCDVGRDSTSTSVTVVRSGMQCDVGRDSTSTSATVVRSGMQRDVGRGSTSRVLCSIISVLVIMPTDASIALCNSVSGTCASDVSNFDVENCVCDL